MCEESFIDLTEGFRLMLIAFESVAAEGVPGRGGAAWLSCFELSTTLASKTGRFFGTAHPFAFASTIHCAPS